MSYLLLFSYRVGQFLAQEGQKSSLMNLVVTPSVCDSQSHI